MSATGSQLLIFTSILAVSLCGVFVFTAWTLNASHRQENDQLWNEVKHLRQKLDDFDQVKDSLHYKNQMRKRSAALNSATDILVEALNEFIDDKLSSLVKCSRNNENETDCSLTVIGEKGEKGNIGNQGCDGNPGFKGDRGAPGSPGEHGSQGPPGARGPKGDPGVVGPMGSPGDRGAAGLAGRPGLPGPRGEPGQKGEAGYYFPFLSGIPSNRGEPGPPGPRGFPGSRGERGLKGAPGEHGNPGAPGFPGPMGPKGRAGDPGPKGSPGFRGLKGQKGESGQGIQTTDSPTTMLFTDKAPTPTQPPTKPPKHDCPGKGWRRVFYLNTTDPKQNCPNGLQMTGYSIKTCGRVTTDPFACDSVAIPVSGTQYREVCGRARAFQWNWSTAFIDQLSTENYNLNAAYLDGISLTRGSPREHIWSFTAGVYTNGTQSPGDDRSRCPCVGGNPSPPFVGNDYFCDSATTAENFSRFIFHPGNALWDGVGSAAACYDEPGVPWFSKTLTRESSDNIEMRLCFRNSDHFINIALQEVEIYVR